MCHPSPIFPYIVNHKRPEYAWHIINHPFLPPTIHCWFAPFYDEHPFDLIVDFDFGLIEMKERKSRIWGLSLEINSKIRVYSQKTYMRIEDQTHCKKIKGEKILSSFSRTKNSHELSNLDQWCNLKTFWTLSTTFYKPYGQICSWVEFRFEDSKGYTHPRFLNSYIAHPHTHHG